MAVFCEFELVLDNDLPAGVLFLGKDVRAEIADIGFHLYQLQVETDFISEQT
jgi:hypothetical protein